MARRLLYAQAEARMKRSLVLLLLLATPAAAQNLSPGRSIITEE
jgi:hypothetical protein